MADDSNLTSEQTDQLICFQEITQIESIDECKQILEAFSWNVEVSGLFFKEAIILLLLISFFNLHSVSNSKLFQRKRAPRGSNLQQQSTKLPVLLTLQSEHQ